MSVLKKNGKLRLCIDFRHLSFIILKDEYLILMTNTLIFVAFGNEKSASWIFTLGITKSSL